jgi:hypothetical protein
MQPTEVIDGRRDGSVYRVLVRDVALHGERGRSQLAGGGLDDLSSAATDRYPAAAFDDLLRAGQAYACAPACDEAYFP